MSAVSKADARSYEDDTQEHVFQMSLRLVPEETADGRVVLRCMDIPVSGAGNSREEALTDLFRQFYLYHASQAYGQRPPTFTSGLASLWDFAGFPQQSEPVDADMDAFATAADWCAVGNDLLTAMNQWLKTRAAEDVS